MGNWLIARAKRSKFCSSVGMASGADAIANLFYDANCFDTNGHNYEAASYSGLHRLKKTGGLYLAYAGGEKGTESAQETSTCADGRANSPGDGKRSMALTAIMT